MNASTGMSAREINRVRRRSIFADEHGCKANDSDADNTAAVSDAIVKSSVKGDDVGECVLPAGTIRLTQELEIHQHIGVRICGRGCSEAQFGPRIWGGWSQLISGTSLYSDRPSSGGNVLKCRSTRNLYLGDMDIFLFASSQSQHADTGILWSSDEGAGGGENMCERVAIVGDITRIPAGSCGMQFGVNVGDGNNDTFKSIGQQFKSLETCVRVKHSQGVIYRFWGLSVHQCYTLFHFEHGGHLFLHSFHLSDNLAADRTLCKVDNAGVNTGHYNISDGFIDRQHDDCHVTIFDFQATAGTCTGNVRDVWFSQLTGPTDYSSSGTAYFELGHKNLVNCIGCKLTQQPIVRWHEASQQSMRAVVRCDGCEIDGTGGVSIPRQMCTSTGGYNGKLYLRECRSSHQIINATVGVYPVAGNRHTHYDWQPHSSGGQSFDGTLGLEDFADSWINQTWAPEAHWKCDEALGATTLADATANGHDLSIDIDMQVAGSALPWLEQSCDFSRSDAGNGRDSGITIAPFNTPVILFGFLRPGDFFNSSKAFMLADSGGGLQYQFFRMTADGGTTVTCSHGTGSTFVATKLEKGTWSYFIVTCNGGLVKTYIDGHLVSSNGAGGWNNALSGNLWIGGGAPNWARGNYTLSRVGVITGQTMTDVEADEMYRSATFVRQRLGYRPT